MTPPPLARSLLARAVADDDAGMSIVGDLDEEFDERCNRIGVWAARTWYWRQAVSIWWWSAWRHPHQSHHQARGDPMFDAIGDVRHAFRVALKTPGQTVLIVATLALGIGVTTIGFAFADTVFLRGLPIADPERTVIVYSVTAEEPNQRLGVYHADLLDFRERSRTVEDLSTWTQTPAAMVRRGADPTRVIVSRVTGDLFRVWGLRTQVGRGLRKEDQLTGAAGVAVLSDRFWREAFGGAATVLGESVLIDGVAHEIVGVMTPDVEFATFANIDAWVSHPEVPTNQRDLTPLAVTARLANGVTVEHAAAEFNALAETLASRYPETNRRRQVLVLQASRAMGGPNIVVVMTLLVGSAALIIVIASVNVAGLLLSRAAARQREFALRIALGAGKRRVVRQLLAEGLLLAGLGSVGGVVVAELGLAVIRSVGVEPIFRQIAIDRHELAFVAALEVITPLLFSLAPAVAALRVNLVGALAAGSPRLVGGGRRLRDGLVVAQLALAIALAVVGGLVARTASALISAPTGLDTSHLLTFTLSLEQYSPDPATRRRGVRSINDRLASELNAQAGTLSLVPSLASEISSPIAVERGSPSAQLQFGAHVVGISESALSTMGVVLAAGRTITANDVETDANVALLSSTAAVRYFGGAAAALDREVTVHSVTSPRVYRVVGVTSDVRDVNPEEGVPSRVWVPLANPERVAFVVKAPHDTAVAAESIRRAVRDLLPGTPVEALLTFDESLRRRTASDRVIMGMLISFTVLGILCRDRPVWNSGIGG
jgi:putative ABC transport system permease protein